MSFMHVSLDGFVAGPKGEMNWIKIDEPMFDMAAEHTDVADTAIYGRVTWELMHSYWPTAGAKPNASRHDKEHSAWYNKVEKFVASRTLKTAPDPTISIISHDFTDKVQEIKNRPGAEIIMFGSPGASHALMRENLIDEYWIFVNPILLGAGIPLFKDINEVIKLDLIESKAFSNGVVCLHYKTRF